MPFPLIPVIAAGASILGSAISRIGTGPRRQAKYSKELFDYQAAYNHPVQQMARLKEAGLNPNLVYGEGTKGATGQQTGMDPVDLAQGDMGSAIPQAVDAYMSTKSAQLKQDQMALQNSLLGINQQEQSHTWHGRAQMQNAENQLKTQEASFGKLVNDEMYKDSGTVSSFAEAKRMQMGLVKQRYLSNQINLYVQDETKQHQINEIAQRALATQYGATLREQEAILKQAEVELYRSLPKSAVTSILMTLRMLLNR